MLNPERFRWFPIDQSFNYERFAKSELLNLIAKGLQFLKYENTFL